MKGVDGESAVQQRRPGLGQWLDLAQLRSHLELLHLVTGLPVGVVDSDDTVLLEVGVHRGGSSAEALARRGCTTSSVVVEFRSGASLELRCEDGLRRLARALSVDGEELGVLVLRDFLHPGEILEPATGAAACRGDDPDGVDEIPRITPGRAELLMDYLQRLVVDHWRQGQSRVQMERALQKRAEGDGRQIVIKEHLENVVNSIADPVFVKDRDHRWLFLNDAFCVFMGYSRQEVIGRSDYDFFPREEADVFWAKDELVFQSGQENLNEEQFTDAQGVTHTIQTKKALYQDQQGAPYIVGVIRDITERKRTEEALIRSQQLAAVGTLAAGIAHEFNNINTSVIGNLQFMLESFELPVEARLLVERAVRAAGRASDLTGRMLGFATPGDVERQLVELDAIVRTTLGLMESEFASEGISLSVQPGQPSPLVRVDGAQISQVLMNLLINARHALLDRPERRIVVSSGLDGKRAFLRVEDTGCGIDPARLQKIFLPFFSGKGEHAQDPAQSGVRGSGLGLSISDTIIRNHGGEITVESELGRGSVFTVVLPAASRPRGKTRAPVEPGRTARPPQRGVRILVLEDEPDVRELLREVLTQWGHEVVCSGDGDQALEAHARQRFEVALVDLQMAPMSGFEFLSRLGADRPAVAVITGRQQSGLADEIRQLGAAELLMKPFDLAELRRTLEKLLAL